MSGPKRLVVLAIDAASPPLLRSWAADGTLPNIARLLATGLVGDTRSVEGLYLGSTWPSFYTGLNPAGHGIYWLDQLKVGTYQLQPVTPGDFARRPALWEVLSGAGRRVVVCDVPLSTRSANLNGVQLAEWGTHDRLFGFRTTPPELKRRVLGLVGRHPLPAPCDTPQRSRREYREFADQLVRGAAARGRLTCRLLSEQAWDFAIQVFSEVHCAGHQLWHYHDSGYPAFDQGTTTTDGDLLRNVYVAVDAAVGEIVATLDPGTTVVLLTLHGMSHMAGASRLLRQILTRLGVVTPPTFNRPDGPESGRERLVRGLRTAYHHVPERIRVPFHEMRARLRQRWIDPGSPISIDPSRTKCFPIHIGPSIGGIRLNLQGREPQGTLAPGAEADRFCAQLTTDLLDIRQPETGHSLVRRVRRTADLYRGPYTDALPDLVVEWDLSQPLGSTVVGTGAAARLAGHSARIGLVEDVNSYGRTGEHRPEGMFVACGPGLPAGLLGRVISNLDLAPTFARVLGCEMPAGDGEVIPELLRP